MSKKNTPKPHDRLKTLDKGDPDARTIFVAVGTACSCWESLHERLASLFCAICDIDDFNLPLMRAFGTLDTAIPKVKMMLAAVEVSVASAEIRLEATALLNSIGDFNHRRNDIAHGLMVSTADGYYLSHGFAPTAKAKLPPGNLWSYKWTAAQIDYYSDEFLRLDTEVSALSERFRSDSLRIAK
jgi:hypothetical protein